jgi:transcriptional regulator with XRE-family HTH domain
MVGQRLKQWRKENSLSQQQLAERISSSSGYISEIESGKTMPGSNFLISLNREFGININWLLLGTEPDHPPPKAKPDRFTEKIVLMLEDMTDEQKEAVRKYAEVQKLAAIGAEVTGGGKTKRRGAA